jgi:predicted RNase H-like HicB family nuclease
MDIRLLVHLEPTDHGSLAWWIEAPDMPGFSAAAPSLTETRIRAELALREILAEQGVDDVAFRYRLVEAEGSEGVDVTRTGAAHDSHEDFDRPVDATRVAAAVP